MTLSTVIADSTIRLLRPIKPSHKNANEPWPMMAKTKVSQVAEYTTIVRKVDESTLAGLAELTAIMEGKRIYRNFRTW